jgi:hypothetical protein
VAGVDTVELDTLRVGSQAGRIAEEIIQHLANLPDAEVRVTLEIAAEMPGPVPEDVLRTVTVNGDVLKVKQGFEEEGG